MEQEELIHQRYRLQRCMASHSGRQTWLALDTKAEQSELVVLKLLQPSAETRWQALDLFEREGQVLAQLNHPRIPAYRESFALNGETLRLGLVQTYIPGPSLKQLLSQGKRFELEQVRSIAQSTLEILSYLHALSPPVLHRDIKPSNIIWLEPEEAADGVVGAYLVDFGAVQFDAPAPGQTFTVVGTYGYAPIEQFAGQAVPASDLYGLGATLVHLLTGVAPMDLPMTVEGLQFCDRISLERPFAAWVAKLIHPSLPHRFATAHDALATIVTGLEFHKPRDYVLMARPYGSRVELQTSTQALHIEIPAIEAGFIQQVGRMLGIAFVATLGLGILLFVVLVGFFSRSLAIFLLFVAMFGPVLFWSIRGSLSKLDAAFAYRLSLDRQRLKFCYRILGIPCWWRNRSIPGIEQVRVSSGAVHLSLPKRTFAIAYGLGLSQDELRWLAQEIDRWNRQGK